MNNSYAFFDQAEVDFSLWFDILKKYKLGEKDKKLMLPHGKITLDNGQKVDRIMGETRKLYFGQAVVDNSFNSTSAINTEVELTTTRLVSWGNCNVHCPYCKRDCQFIDNDGNPITSIMVSITEILSACVAGHLRGEVVRFSGGDPVMFKRETLAIAEYMWKKYSVKISIAHNGTGTGWVNDLLPYLSSAAIDLKAVPSKISYVMGIDQEKGPKMYQKSLDTQSIISKNRILLDVRTPIFGDTPTADMIYLANDIVKTNDLRYTFWTWRLYKKVEGCDWSVPDKDLVIQQMLEVSKKFPKLWMGIRAKWQRGGMEYIRNGQIVAHTQDHDLNFDPEYGSGNKNILAPN